MQSNVTPRDSRTATRGNATRTKGIQESKNCKNFSYSLCQTAIRASFAPPPHEPSDTDSRGIAKPSAAVLHAILSQRRQAIGALHCSQNAPASAQSNV
jgi:hypothetical protein